MKHPLYAAMLLSSIVAVGVVNHGPVTNPLPAVKEYSARTDRKIVPYPETPPALGPAGSVITDPSFGSRIARVTDPRSDTRQPGRSLVTPSSSEQNPWNKTSTMFYVETLGGMFVLYDFDPVTMKSSPARTHDLVWNGEPEFSYQNQNLLYGIVRRDPTFQEYNVATGKVTDVDKPSKCLKLQSSDSGHDITVSGDDTRFMMVLGPQQDSNDIIYVFDRVQGCRWYNTQTGEVGGQWGPKGTVTIPDRFPIHNARMAKSGKFVYIVRGGGGPTGRHWVVWEIETMNASVCPSACSSHHALGYTHILGPSGLTHPLDLWLRPLKHPESTTPLISGLESSKGLWYDSHYSWNNVDPDDSAPVCFSTYRPNNPDAPGVAPLVAAPWDNEIDCAETDGKGSKVWRFAHTYSTAHNGFWSTPRGNVSQDGRFFIFTSDWEDQLGKLPNGDKYRTDVFIVELK